MPAIEACREPASRIPVVSSVAWIVWICSDIGEASVTEPVFDIERRSGEFHERSGIGALFSTRSMTRRHHFMPLSTGTEIRSHLICVRSCCAGAVRCACVPGWRCRRPARRRRAGGFHVPRFIRRSRPRLRHAPLAYRSVLNPGPSVTASAVRSPRADRSGRGGAGQLRQSGRAAAPMSRRPVKTPVSDRLFERIPSGGNGVRSAPTTHRQ